MTDPRYQEITLADVWAALKQRYHVAVLVLVTSVVVSVGYSLSVKPTYESFVVVQIGIMNLTKLEDSKELAARLEGAYDVHARGQKSDPYLAAVTVDQSTIRLVARGTVPQRVTSFLEKIAANVLQRHEAIMAGRRQLLIDKRASLVQLLDAIPSIDKRTAGGQGEPYRFVLGVEAEIRDVDDRLASVNMVETAVIRKADLPARPINLPPVVFLIAGLLAGILAAILIVVALEAASRRRVV